MSNGNNLAAPAAGITTFTRGNKFFELSNHLGNVLVTVSDKKLGHTTDGTTVDYYNADVITANDYYPGGMLMPGRKFAQSNSSYRYGFNGKELDADPIQYDYGFRIYDPRLARFKSIDPLTRSYSQLTPYQFAENSPILFIDLDGLEKALPWYLGENKNGGKPVLTLGLGKIPTAEKLVHGTEPALSDKAIITFASNVLVSAWNGIANTWNGAKDGKTGSQMVQESISSIEKLKPQDLKKVETWEDIGGFIVTLYGLKKIGSIKELKLSADLPSGTVINGFSMSRMGAGLVKKASEFKLTHSIETIINSADYNIISKLSDKDLIQSVLNPSDYRKVTINTETGKLFDGNTRIYELQKRNLNVDVPYQEYTPDNSVFPNLKEPPKTK